jgi:hypothetical protein
MVGKNNNQQDSIKQALILMPMITHWPARTGQKLVQILKAILKNCLLAQTLRYA